MRLTAAQSRFVHQTHILVTSSASGKGSSVVIGVLGALLGGVLFSLLGLRATWLLGRLIIATVGSVALIAIVHWVQSRNS